MSARTQAGVQRLLDAATADPNNVPGAVFLMMDREGKFLANVVSGVRGVDQKDGKITTDTAFVAFSCTKIITMIACLQVVEKGLLKLDDPVELEAVLPEIIEVKMMDGSALKQKITLRMLLLHTAGLAYHFWNEDVLRWSTENLPVDPMKWETYKQRLVAQPGEDWNYGWNLDWAAKALEAVTGQGIDQYCKENIFDPLGIQNIRFNKVPTACEDKLASQHMRLPDGTMIRIDHAPGFLSGDFEAPGAGCIMTPEDFIQVIFILINEGKGLNGAQILPGHWIDEMFKDQLEGTPAVAKKALERTLEPAIPAISHPVIPIPGVESSWSYAGMLTKDPLPSGRSANSVWWAGLANCYWMADREKGVVNVIKSQYFPFYDDAILEPYRAAEKAVYDSLV